MLMRWAAALVGVRMTNRSPSDSVRMGLTRSFRSARSSFVRVAVADMIEDRNEGFVALAEHLRQLEQRSPGAFEQGRHGEKERAAELGFKMRRDLGFLDDRRQLMQIAEQQQPYAAEGLAGAAAVDAQRLVDRPHQVRADHGDLVDDEQLQTPHDRAVAAAADILVADEARRQAKEGMDGLAAGIDRGETRRRHDGHVFLGHIAQCPQQRRFAGTGAPGDKKVAFAPAHVVQSADVFRRRCDAVGPGS